MKQIVKEEVLLYVHNDSIHNNLKKPTKEVLQLTNTFSEMAGYNIN